MIFFCLFVFKLGPVFVYCHKTVAVWNNAITRTCWNSFHQKKKKKHQKAIPQSKTLHFIIITFCHLSLVLKAPFCISWTDKWVKVVLVEYYSFDGENVRETSPCRFPLPNAPPLATPSIYQIVGWGGWGAPFLRNSVYKVQAIAGKCSPLSCPPLPKANTRKAPDYLEEFISSVSFSPLFLPSFLRSSAVHPSQISLKAGKQGRFAALPLDFFHILLS